MSAASGGCWLPPDARCHPSADCCSIIFIVRLARRREEGACRTQEAGAGAEAGLQCACISTACTATTMTTGGAAIGRPREHPLTTPSAS